MGRVIQGLLDHPAFGKSKATVAAAGEVSDLTKHPELDALG